MNKIENLALELAMLSNHSLYQLSEIMSRDYPTRLDAVEQAVHVAQQEKVRLIATELDIA